MNYIYDVLLNFKPVLYDFYEWDADDDIQHIRRIPIIRVSRSCLHDLKNNKVKIDDTFLNRYKNKTEVFQRKSVKTIDLSLIFTDTEDALALMFNKGETVSKSSMLIDEEEDLLEIARTCPIETFSYEIIKADAREIFKTRREEEMSRYIEKEIGKITNPEKLEYLYFECFNEKPEKDVSIKGKIRESLYIHFGPVAQRLYEVLKLTSIKK